MMKALLVVVTLILCHGMGHCSPYFRFRPTAGAGLIFAPQDPSNSGGVTDLALWTHSTKDGSIMPSFLRPYLPPIAWAPLQIGQGGSFNGDYIVTAGGSMDFSPALAHLLMKGVDSRGSGFLPGLKAALESQSQGLQFRLGIVFAGSLVRGGTWQPLNQAFPGSGLPDIAYRAMRFNVGPAWEF
jgi:hypothetical protein